MRIEQTVWLKAYASAIENPATSTRVIRNDIANQAVEDFFRTFPGDISVGLTEFGEIVKILKVCGDNYMCRNRKGDVVTYHKSRLKEAW